MFNKAFKAGIPFTLSCVSAASLLACSPATSSTDNTQIIGHNDRLSSAEWSAYIANSQYLQELTAPNVAVQLNLADPRQYDFIKARFQLAGKDPTNSPHLFELLEAQRQTQMTRGLKAGTFAPATVATPDGRVEMHYIQVAGLGLPKASAKLAGGSAAAPKPLAWGTAGSTFPDGSEYTSVDVSISTVTGVPIANLVTKDEFDNPNGNIGANVTVNTSGDPSASTVTRYRVESSKFEDRPDGSSATSYVRAEFGSQALRAVTGLPMLSSPVIDAPRDLRGNNTNMPDDLISVCMDRSWTNDCDYQLNTGSTTDQRIKMPAKGAVSLITTEHKFDRAAIQAMKDGLNMIPPQPPSDPGGVKLILTNVGGGCDVDATNALNAGMNGFWNFVTLSADDKTLFWNATESNALYFDEGCRQVQDFAKFTMRIPVPVVTIAAPPVAFTASFTITNDDTVQRPDATIPRVTLTNSCLAEGTEIQLGGGKLAPIESLEIGQTIFNPYATGGHTLTIKDTAKGNERAPMVRIRDGAGRTLLMTEMHPISTPDRGMVQARALRVGDVVMTTQGPTTLTEVSREPYSGKVYNLKVGSEAEAANLGPDQTVVYANGFVVGDGQIQSKYESLSVKHGPKTIEEVPEAWRRDYLLSRSRQ